MAKDDFIRIIYNKEVEGRKKRTSVSCDPDLYQVFCLIRGNAPLARLQIRAWAVEADSDRVQAAYGGIGTSRLVHRRMLAEIRELVEKGLVVERHEGVDRNAQLDPIERAKIAKDALEGKDGAEGAPTKAKKSVKKKAEAKSAEATVQPAALEAPITLPPGESVVPVNQEAGEGSVEAGIPEVVYERDPEFAHSA